MRGKPADTTTERSGAAIADSPAALLYFIAAAAILLGLWGRFKGLGAWPLSDDEYYTARAVQDILRVGTPEYDCGGWYVRGVPFQYLAALLQLAGAGPEMSLRIITAISSLVALPAAYILGKRAHSKTAGLLVVTILAVSVWEIELARFGRMYAPFQAIFTWYLVYFVRYVVDQDRRALGPMLGLSVLGALAWEGGLFVLALNALPPFIGNIAGRLTWRHVGLVLTASALVVPLYALLYVNFRQMVDVPPYPAGFDYSPPQPTDGASHEWMPTWRSLLHHPGWAIALLGLAASGVVTLPWIWRIRDRWIAAVGLLLALALAFAHQFTATACVLLLMLLARIMRPSDFLAPGARAYGVAILVSLVAWAALGLLSDQWIPHGASTWLGDGRMLVVLQELFGRPDFLRQIVKPWVGAESLYGLVLVVLLAIAVARDLRSPSPYPGTLSVLLLVVVVMLVAVGVSQPPRQESRYVFFLYPAVLIIVVSTGLVLLRHTDRKGALARLVAPITILAVYVVLEDFRPRHLVSIDSTAASLRIGFSGRFDDHLIARTDPRSAARWVDAHATRPDDLLVNGYPAASFYSSRFAFAYTDIEHQRFRAFACSRGTIERWSNLPLLSTQDELAGQIRNHGQTFFVADKKQVEQLLAGLPEFEPTVVWQSLDGGVSVVRLIPNPAR